MAKEKTPQEASNIFHSIMKASVKPKNASEMPNYELVLRFIEMHPELNSPIHIAIGNRVTKSEVEEILNDSFVKGYITLTNEKPEITEAGKKYLNSLP